MKRALIGYGGHAREVMAQMGAKLTCFVDDEYVVYGTNRISEFLIQKTDLILPKDYLKKQNISAGFIQRL
jgi:hypothetical protein